MKSHTLSVLLVFWFILHVRRSRRTSITFRLIRRHGRDSNPSRFHKRKKYAIQNTKPSSVLPSPQRLLSKSNITPTFHFAALNNMCSCSKRQCYCSLLTSGAHIHCIDEYDNGILHRGIPVSQPVIKKIIRLQQFTATS